MTTPVSSITNSNSSSPSWPTPDMPGTGGFDASIPSNLATTYNGTGYLDKLKDGLAAITSSQSPTVIQGVLAYIINLTNDPAKASTVEAFLSQNLNMNSLIQTGTLQGMESAFFMGYNGVSGLGAAATATTPGTGAEGYITDMLTALQPYTVAIPPSTAPNPYAVTMTNALNGLNAMLPTFVADHTDSSGKMIWTYGGVTYTWDTSSNGSTTNPTSDNFYIANLITGISAQGTPNTLFADLANNFNQMEADWRIQALQQLLAEFKDPIDAIMLWMTTAYDNQYQSNESALANTTNSLTVETNSYATPLLQDIKDFGSLAGTSTTPGSPSAQNFVQTLLNWNNFVAMNPNSSTIASSLQTNTITPILNTVIQGTTTLGGFLTNISNGVSGYTYDTLAAALNNLNPATPTSGSTTSSTSPAYLAMVNAAQAGGDLVTQTSKQTSTDLTQNANLDNALLQLGSAAVNPQGSGPLAFQQAIVNNQRTAG